MSTQMQGELVPEWTVGDRLRKARELRELEQGPFAALIGVSRGTVSNYERGATERYKPIVMNAWAAHTGVSVDWLLSGVPSTTPPDRGRPMSDRLERLTEQKRSRSRGSKTTRHYLPRVPALAQVA
jgi:transcriptional regulator with XRE-family HTH domain